MFFLVAKTANDVRKRQKIISREVTRWNFDQAETTTQLQIHRVLRVGMNLNLEKNEKNSQVPIKFIKSLHI